ncbi:DUF6538 domain-containing protein [Primorskyibacter marinus]|uniref:DUF6538 domain-containing protein n=1 Tax=Primorskyibacter marinus TaxID=1977320 RepID=UPI000E300221|nr:DUF6538 domain-containing protein [Primorskyibacter marinus]
MTITLFENGAFLLQAKFIERRKNVYYFRRRIPHDVRHKYPGKPENDFVSLKTKDPKVAAERAHQRAGQQDAVWQAIRNGEDLTTQETRDAALGLLDRHKLKPGQHVEFKREHQHAIGPDRFLDGLRHSAQNELGEVDEDNLLEHEKIAVDLFYGKKLVPLLSDAVELYESLQGKKSSDKTKANRRNVMKELYAVAGDIPVDKYTRQHANDLVKRLAAKGNKTGTVKRKLNYLAPVMATALREYEIDKQNVFHRLHIPDFGEDTKERDPYTAGELEQLKDLYRRNDDDIRWAAALMHDTGARLAEIIGLRCDDIVLDTKIPHIRLAPHDTRSMKTRQSERDVPLVGTALWAARRIKGKSKGHYAFPRYEGADGFKSTHASNAINSSLKSVVPGKTGHCFRHAMRDRLRNVECPSEVANAICGWKTDGVGEGYGKGYSLDVKLKWLSKVASPFEEA